LGLTTQKSGKIFYFFGSGWKTLGSGCSIKNWINFFYSLYFILSYISFLFLSLSSKMLIRERVGGDNTGALSAAPHKLVLSLSTMGFPPPPLCAAIVDIVAVAEPSRPLSRARIGLGFWQALPSSPT